MIDINYDTAKISALGENLIKLSEDYISLVTSLQARIQKMPNITKEWVGPAAERFVAVVNVEMNNYIELGQALSTYGPSLLAASDNIISATNRGRGIR